MVLGFSLNFGVARMTTLLGGTVLQMAEIGPIAFDVCMTTYCWRQEALCVHAAVTVGEMNAVLLQGKWNWCCSWFT